MAKKTDTNELLRTIINNMSTFKQEFLKKFDEIDKKFTGKIDRLDKKIDGVEQRLTERIDTLGKQLAYLEDDAPTREEFGKLEKRVDKLEQKPSSAL